MLRTVLLTLAVSLGAADANAVIKPLPSEEVIRRISACGIASKDIRMEDDSDLQEDVVRIRERASVSISTYRCVAAVSLDTVRYVYFDGLRQTAYAAIYYEVERQHGVTVARRWFSDRGLLQKMPQLNSHGDLAAYSVQLEKACGVVPHQGLVTSGGGLTFRADNLLARKISDDAFTCMTSGAALAGVSIGFVGNAAVTPKRP